MKRFGDVNAVHIAADAESGYTVRHVVTGDTVKDVLQYVSYDQRSLMDQLRRAIEVAIARGRMTFEQSASLVKHFEAGLAGYTYLESPDLVETLLNSIVPKPRLVESALPVPPAADEVEERDASGQS